MQNVQAGILAPVPHLARYLNFSLKPETNPANILATLGDVVDGNHAVIGLGLPLVLAMGGHIPGLRNFPNVVGPAIEIPSTPGSLWCWLRGEDRGELLHQARTMSDRLAPAFRLEQTLDAFQYGPGLDLTGYEDGTENPTDDAALEAAIAQAQGLGLDGSSFVAIQQWVHDLDCFQAMSPQDQDNAIGRRKSDNEEIADAPISAHVKRTAQETFSPEAFILRRSMPWADADHEGLMFVAFGKSFNAFEAQLNRMVGAEDKVTDALFKFTRPISGSYYWCPPMAQNGGLDLSALNA